MLWRSSRKSWKMSKISRMLSLIKAEGAIWKKGWWMDPAAHSRARSKHRVVLSQLAALGA